jgi:hypothetical protein
MTIKILGKHRRRHKDFTDEPAVSLQEISSFKNLKKRSHKRNFADQGRNKDSLRVCNLRQPESTLSLV